MNLIRKQLLQSVFLSAILPSIMCSVIAVSDRSGEWRYPEDVRNVKSAIAVEIPVLHQSGNIQMMDLEEYIANVVLGEVSAGFHAEALKSQAVAARTYTLRCVESGSKHDGGAVCTDYHCCQAYREPEDYYKDGGTREAVNKIRSAVSDTAGEVLYYEDELVCATYFASSGGMTEDAAEVWGGAYPYLKSTPSPGEEDCEYFSSIVTITPQELQKQLGVSLTGKPSSWFGLVTDTAGGGVDLMRIGGKLYTGVELRKLFGLRSTVFTVIPSDELITFDVKGYGHRVGMSQHGANAMASAGSTYQEILAHYYSQTTLTQYTQNND